MSNSSLVDYIILSPNRYHPRNHKIDTITIHCMAGQLSAQSCGSLFKNGAASSNYGIGYDGKIALYVDEGDGSWCSSSYSNDMRAITIEVASDKTHPYAVTDAAYKSLIKLLVDICKRNGIKQLLWKADKNLIGQVDKQNMTAHRWFKNKACPGDYLYNRFGTIAEEVNLRLKGGMDPKGNTKYVGTGIGSAVCKNSEYMSVRLSSNASSEEIGRVYYGQKVEVLRILASGWMKIVWPGNEKLGYGYVSNVKNKYFDYTPNSAPKPTYNYLYPVEITGVSKDSWLNVRTAADPNASIYKAYPKLYNGNQVDVIKSGKAKDGGIWYNVSILGPDKKTRYDGGWINSKFTQRY